MDSNVEMEMAKAIIDAIDDRMEKKLPELLAKVKFQVVGKVVTAGSGTTISVYINNSTTAVTVQNPRSFSLTAGVLVGIIYPNLKLDNMAYIDRIL